MIKHLVDWFTQNLGASLVNIGNIINFPLYVVGFIIIMFGMITFFKKITIAENHNVLKTSFVFTPFLQTFSRFALR